ncbi:MAG: signal peptidase I [Candidatus Berkelbacteria bacterium]|nr:signal peptidase I [Candidatus Berkelbacteria bacterium]
MISRDTFIGRIVYGGGFIFDFARWLVFIIVILTLLHFFVITIFIVDGASMDPTLATGDFGLLDKISYDFSDPQRGDVVVLNYPGDPDNKRYVKRVVGLPGEKIEVKNGLILINGKKLSENYLPKGLYTDKDGNWKLSGNEYFTMGDNRPNSNDSRYFGPVEKRFLVGKVVWILFPRFFSIVTPTY